MDKNVPRILSLSISLLVISLIILILAVSFFLFHLVVFNTKEMFYSFIVIVVCIVSSISLGIFLAIYCRPPKK